MGTGTSGAACPAGRLRLQGLQQGQPAGDTGGVHADPPTGKDGQGLQGGRGSGETDKGDNQVVAGK